MLINKNVSNVKLGIYLILKHIHVWSAIQAAQHYVLIVGVLEILCIALLIVLLNVQIASYMIIIVKHAKIKIYVVYVILDIY